MAYSYNTFDAWLRGHGFASSLDASGEVRNGTSQGFFASQYSAWLTDLLAFYADAIRARYDLASDVQFGIALNQNDPTGLPIISGLTGEQVAQLFGDTSDFAWGGKGASDSMHVRYYANSFVLSPDHAPVAAAVTAGGTEDAHAVAVSLTATDPDAGDAVESFTLTSLPLSGEGILYTDADLQHVAAAGVAYAASGGTLTLYFAPPENFNGQSQFNYTASDGELSSAAATATITLSQQNDAAIFTGDISGSGNENGGPIVGTLTVADPADGITTPNFRISNGDEASGGIASIDPISGHWTYVPNADFTGADHFTVSVTDDDGNVEKQSIDIALSPIDHNVPDFAILVFPASLTVSGGMATQLIFGQVFEAGLTEAQGAAPGLVAELGYGPSGTDPTVSSNWIWLDASFNAQSGSNDEYSATIGSQSVTAGSYAYTYRFGISVGGQSPTDWTYADLDGTGNGFDFNQLGLMTVMDGGGVNHAPIAGDDFAQVSVNFEIEAHAPGVLANDTDPDGDALEVVAINGDASQIDDGSFIALPSGAHIQIFNDGAYDYLPDAPVFFHLALGQSYVDMIAYTIQDGHGLTSDAKLVITVNGILPGSPPAAVDDIGATNEDTVLSGSGQFGLLSNDSDFDGQGTLTVAAVNGSEAAVGHQVALPSGALVSVLADGTYTYNPNGHFDYLQSGESAVDSFDYAAANAVVICATASVTVTISGLDEPPPPPPPPPDPHAPVAGDDVAQVFVNSEAIALPPGLLANDYDPDGDRIEVATVGGHPADGSFISLPSGALIQAFEDGTYDYVPDVDASANLAPGESYVDTIPYTIRDTTGLTSGATLEITVIAPEAILEFPTTLTIGSGQTPQVYGNISAAELTEPLGCSPNIVAQFGYGASGTSPTTSASWIWSDASFNSQLPNADEYAASIPDDLLPGNYAYTYRFGLSIDGQAPVSWVYADLDGSGNGFNPSHLGSLFVM